MTGSATHRGNRIWTRITVLGLVISALAMMIGPIFLDGYPGPLLVGVLLLVTAGLVWRFGLAAHVWAAILGCLLVLENGWFTIANLAGAADHVGVLVNELLLAIGGGITLFGAVRFLLAHRRVVRVEGCLSPGSLSPTAGGAGDSKLPYRLLAGLAIVIQGILCLYFFVMGLGWGGAWYVANLAQAVTFLGLALALFWTRPLLVLPLPGVSLLLMLVFEAADPSLKTTECTPAQLSAAAELPPPTGSPAPEFQSEPANGCIARFNSTLTGDQVLDHYRLAAKDAGWEVDDPGELVEPRQEPVTPGMGGLSMRKEQMVLELNVEPAGEEGPARDQTWVVVSVG